MEDTTPNVARKAATVCSVLAQGGRLLSRPTASQHGTQMRSGMPCKGCPQTVRSCASHCYAGRGTSMAPRAVLVPVAQRQRRSRSCCYRSWTAGLTQFRAVRRRWQRGLHACSSCYYCRGEGPSREYLGATNCGATSSGWSSTSRWTAQATSSTKCQRSPGNSVRFRLAQYSRRTSRGAKD